MQRRQLLQWAGAASAVAASGHVRAQADKALSLVVGYAAGGSADLTARVVAAELAKKLGRPVIVENLAGASGMLAAQKVLNAPADGTTLYMGGTDTVAVPMVNPRFKFDWSKDFSAIGRMTTLPMVFCVPGTSPYQQLGDLLTHLRKPQREPFFFATPGVGTMQHFYGALINLHGKVAMEHVPYRGGSPIANDLVGGQVHSAVLVLSTALPFLRDGKIRALSVSGASRAPQLPQVKPIGEEDGFQGLSLPLWQGLFVKQGTPASATKALEKALMDALDQPEVKTRLGDAGVTVAPLSGDQMHSFVSPQAKLYRDIVTTAKISVD